MIKVRDLCKSFDGQTVLKGLNLDIKDGEILVVLGESGSGKSVFLKHLIGIIKPDQGTVEIDGVDITRLPEKKPLGLAEKHGIFVSGRRII